MSLGKIGNNPATKVRYLSVEMLCQSIYELKGNFRLAIAMDIVYFESEG
jgi:hypothetical protein